MRLCYLLLEEVLASRERVWIEGVCGRVIEARSDWDWVPEKILALGSNSDGDDVLLYWRLTVENDRVVKMEMMNE